MKVLVIASHIYESSLSKFLKNKTGFGIMVNEILKSTGQYDDIFLLTNVITPKVKLDNYTIVQHKWNDILKSFSIKYTLKGIKASIRFKQTLKDRMKYIYYYMNSAYAKKVIADLKPDIVHIHGIGYVTKPYIEICEELNIPFVVTLHGLIGLDESVLASKQDRDLEKEFLLYSEINNIPVTVISTGIKKRILEKYNLKTGENIRVITNGTSIERINFNKLDIREKYNINKENKILLCIGNICERKNQIQIVEAYDLLDKNLKEKTNILFIGGDTLNGELQNKIKALGYEKNLIYCGFVEKNEIFSYWYQSKGNIVASLDEGFGLSIIEGFVYGIPTVTFSDLDALDDIYNEKAMLLVDSRSSQELAEGIEQLLKNDWNSQFISQYSKQFSLEKMATEYRECYLDITKREDKYA